ncbi:coenzyme F430 synthase, partial [Methanoregula sp.]|uniref:coenzyme F430 synthase n=1 Tax=Methanoregula sp. TaxID=2052170 RepID=UPI000CB7BBB6
MKILVLDSIHGGQPIAAAFVSRGNQVDLVDVYRGTGPVSVEEAHSKTYDLITAPVHLDPDHPLIKNATAAVITHHDAVRHLLGRDVPEIMVEITGARGKTTTAHALALLLPGPGVLHTSAGTFRYPGKTFISRSSITPGSVLEAVRLAREAGGWLITEESLGLTGAGRLGIITSSRDYRFAAGKKSALEAKLSSARSCRALLLPGRVADKTSDGAVLLQDAAKCDGAVCTITLGSTIYRFENPLLALPAYRNSLALAGTAAVMLGIDPAPLAAFTALSGRMSAKHEGGVLIVDNANSGTNLETTLDAAKYARNVSGRDEITLVIGQPEGDGAGCEAFGCDQILAAVQAGRAVGLVL